MLSISCEPPLPKDASSKTIGNYTSSHAHFNQKKRDTQVGTRDNKEKDIIGMIPNLPPFM